MATSKYETSSLGFTSIPLPKNYNEGPTYSFEEYKDLTGVDLNDIFHVEYDGEKYCVSFNPEHDKLLVIDASKAVYAGDTIAVIPPMNIVTADMVEYSDNAVAASATLSITISLHSGQQGIAVIVSANKSIAFNFA